MLDAGAAVAASLGLRAAIGVSPAAPQAGQVVTLTSQGSTVASGRTIARRDWSLDDGGGIVSGFDGATNQASATVQPTAGGQFTVRLTITDDMGTAVSARQSITVAGAPAVAASSSGGSGGGGSGGGSMATGWLLALATATLLLTRRRVCTHNS
jgi:serine protease